MDVSEKKNLLALLGIELPFLDCPAHIASNYGSG
jgi:hypothetical protein